MVNSEFARFLLPARSQVVKGESIEKLEAINREFKRSLKGWFQPHISAGKITPLPPELRPALIIGPAQEYARSWLAGKTRVASTRPS